jgi:hypothetical protein
MAKRPTSPDSAALKYPASTAYKQWVWKEIRRRADAERGRGAGALQWLVDEMKRRARHELLEIGKLETISTATLSQLLGPEDEVPPPSSSVLLPAINKALGIDPPPVCDPDDEMQQLVERFKRAWARATPRERNVLLAALGPANDEGGMDGSRAGDGDASGAASRARG